MGKWTHRLSNINLETLTGDCDYCGPGVKIMNSDRIRCWTGRQKGGTYGDTKINYEQKLALWNQESDRRCKICDTGLTYETAVLDHCHETSRLRNFLCGMCNSMIGFAKEDVGVLQRAIAYITDEGKWLNVKAIQD